MLKKLFTLVVLSVFDFFLVPRNLLIAVAISYLRKNTQVVFQCKTGFSNKSKEDLSIYLNQYEWKDDD